MDCSEFAAAFLQLEGDKQEEVASLLSAQGTPVPKRLRAAGGGAAPGAGAGDGGGAAPAPGT
eukprot:3592595-Pyramimonas_sp.AAC.1